MVTIFSMNPGSSISFAVIPINREKKLHTLRHIPVGLWLPVIQWNCGHFALKSGLLVECGKKGKIVRKILPNSAGNSAEKSEIVRENAK